MDIDETAIRIHRTAVDHGFWDKPRNLGEMLMLVASELAECLEEDRAGMAHVYYKCRVCGYTTIDSGNDRAGHYIPTPTGGVVARILSVLYRGGTPIMCSNNGPLKPEGALVEIADAIIRLLDTGHDMSMKTRYTLAEIMQIKMDYNDQRERMHGKAY